MWKILLRAGIPLTLGWAVGAAEPSPTVDPAPAAWVVPASRAKITDAGLFLDGGSQVFTLTADDQPPHRVFLNQRLMSAQQGRVFLDDRLVATGSPAETWLRSALALVPDGQEKSIAQKTLHRLDQRAQAIAAAAASGPLTPAVATGIALDTLRATFGDVRAAGLATDDPKPEAVVVSISWVIVRFARPDVQDPTKTVYLPVVIDRETREVIGALGWSDRPEPALND